MNACENKRVLSQSYRVPKSVFRIANHLVHRINDRQEKAWNPRTEDGNVDFHMNWYDVNIDEGSWTIMARTNKTLNSIQESLRQDGYLFERFGHSSISTDLLEAMSTWERLARGETAGVGDIKKLYGFMPKQGEKALLKHGVQNL